MLCKRESEKNYNRFRLRKRERDSSPAASLELGCFIFVFRRKNACTADFILGDCCYNSLNKIELRKEKPENYLAIGTGQLEFWSE